MKLYIYSNLPESLVVEIRDVLALISNRRDQSRLIQIKINTKSLAESEEHTQLFIRAKDLAAAQVLVVELLKPNHLRPIHTLVKRRKTAELRTFHYTVSFTITSVNAPRKS